MIFGNAIATFATEARRHRERPFRVLENVLLSVFSVSPCRSAHLPAGALCLVWLATRRAPYCSTPVLITLVSQLAACASPTTITVTLPPGAAEAALAPPAGPEAAARPLARDP